QQHPVLGNPPPQELSAQQISTLLQHAGNREKLLIALLLSGVTLEEAPAIGKEDIDFENEKLIVKSESPRIIPLNPALKSLFAKTTYRLVSASGDPLSSEDLAALITCAILDADLSGADEINAASLRQTYIIYLVKQGIRLSELEKITGYIPPKELSSYSIYSPPGPKRAYEVIDKVYPELLNIDQIR
ncbi:MAG TPA: tyrosine-type recombinase/integrase, partial [Nitrosomonas sp.]|nr:tyrosine-type recombinase/integrase [Nitrosomonas sp.]